MQSVREFKEFKVISADSEDLKLEKLDDQPEGESLDKKSFKPEVAQRETQIVFLMLKRVKDLSTVHYALSVRMPWRSFGPQNYENDARVRTTIYHLKP